MALLLHLVAALVSRRLSVILSAAGMLVATLAQMALGMGHIKTAHVPLGVLMFGVSLLQLGRVWSARRTTMAAT